MKKKIQNKLGTYLAVTAGVGCAASVAEGAIVVVDLSGLSPATGIKTIPNRDGLSDFYTTTGVLTGGFRVTNGGQFFSDMAGISAYGGFARGYSGSALAAFPGDPDADTYWALSGFTGGGFAVGENWVAFKDSSGSFGWMSFTLISFGVNSTVPIASFGHFVYDDTSTEPSNAITLQAAVAAAAAAAAVPEPSSLVLFALGATGIAARRQRKKAA